MSDIIIPTGMLKAAKEAAFNYQIVPESNSIEEALKAAFLWLAENPQPLHRDRYEEMKRLNLEGIKGPSYRSLYSFVWEHTQRHMLETKTGEIIR